MQLAWIFLFWLRFILIKSENQQDDGQINKKMHFVSRTRSNFLERYKGYNNAILLLLNVPEETLFASFLFVAEEIDFSIFGCSKRDVSLYMKHGALPVINPDGSKMPKLFKNITGSHLYNLEFNTDKRKNYINITSPLPGPYYIAVFLSYSDPRNDAITQKGLTSNCMPTVEATLFINQLTQINRIVENQFNLVNISLNEKVYYKFYIPESIDHVILKIDKIAFASTSKLLSIKIQSEKLPSDNDNLKTVFLYPNVTKSQILCWVSENTWNYLEFVFTDESDDLSTDENLINFKLQFYTNDLVNSTLFVNNKNNSVANKLETVKFFKSNKLTEIMPFKQYTLVKEASTDSFTFTYELEQEVESSNPVPINITNQHFTVLKFDIKDIDIGGTLQYILAFKPSKNKAVYENLTVVACIRPYSIEVPTFPNGCRYFNRININSSLVLNKTVTNATIMIPYPEIGRWYATFKLFCDNQCEPCNCSESCQNLYEECTMSCDNTCNARYNDCHCAYKCSQEVYSNPNCRGCDCDGPCRRNTDKECNSAVLFDISSQPCIYGQCGRNGICLTMVSSSLVYATCACINNYRGWDCSDDYYATPYWKVVLELCLLVLSNLAFLPASYVAFKRNYCVESITYFSICFFSTFYHACDAGENIISFCITKLSALQFADFFCATLAIFVTLVAIADLPSFYPNVCQILGAVILSFCTTIDKTSLWVFVIPAVSGLTIIIINWYLKWRKIRQHFLCKKYLYVYCPLGIGVVIIGLIIYTLLQTESNYMYLHSLWHMIMAAGVLLLLPKSDTFLPGTLL